MYGGKMYLMQVHFPNKNINYKTYKQSRVFLNKKLKRFRTKGKRYFKCPNIFYFKFKQVLNDC